MTTEALRKVIKVTYWMIGEKGLSISYVREDHNPQSLHLILDPEETVKELLCIGSIEAFDLGEKIQVRWEEFPNKFVTWGWPVFILGFKLCQWEALSIVIRHEEEKELANDMNMLELDAAIDALK
jgi:hypothetical protein